MSNRQQPQTHQLPNTLDGLMELLVNGIDITNRDPYGPSHEPSRPGESLRDISNQSSRGPHEGPGGRR